MDENKLMMQFLSEELGTNDPKKIQNYLKGLDESKQKALAQKYQQWKEAKKKKQATKAAHGAKLNYVKSLKHICPEGEELVYFKKGGLMQCGCKGKKMEEGAKVEEAKCGAVAKFKKVKKAATGVQISPIKKKEGWRGNDYIVTKKGISEREKLLNSNKNEEGEADPNRNKPKSVQKPIQKSIQSKPQNRREEPEQPKVTRPKPASSTKRDSSKTIKTSLQKKGGAVDAFKAKCGSKMKKK